MCVELPAILVDAGSKLSLVWWAFVFVNFLTLPKLSSTIFGCVLSSLGGYIILYACAKGGGERPTCRKAYQY